MAIPDITGINLEYLETFSLRPLRELALHNAGIKPLPQEAIDFNLAKLQEIDDELARRRS